MKVTDIASSWPKTHFFFVLEDKYSTDLHNDGSQIGTLGRVCCHFYAFEGNRVPLGLGQSEFTVRLL